MTNKFAQAAAKAVEQGKLNEHDREGGGDFEYEVPAKGLCMGRLVTYAEIGTHPQKPYQGQAKPPASECIVQFELLGKKHAKEITFNDEHGKPVTKTIYPIITQRMTIKSGAKSGYTKLINALDYGRGNAVIPMMLGEAFKIDVQHNEVEKDGKKVTYANLKDKDGVWMISAPVVQKMDEETGEPIGDPQPVKAPPATVELRCLMWDAPDMDQWNSLFIAGTYTKKDGKNEVEVSKNWMQDAAKNALNWEGSAVAVLVSTIEGDLPDLDTSEMGEDLPVEDDEPDLGTSSADEETSATSGSDNGSGEESDDDDPLAGLDLED